MFTAYKREKFHCAERSIWCRNRSLLKSTKVQKVLTKPLHSTLEEPVGFLTHFSHLFVLTYAESLALSSQQYFSLCLYTALRAEGCVPCPKLLSALLAQLIMYVENDQYCEQFT